MASSSQRITRKLSKEIFMKRTTCSLIIAAALTTASVSANAENTWKDTAKDAWIDGKAESTLLLNGNLNSFDINTDVKNGVVTLTGKVESSVDKSLAEELVSSLDGVTEVDNMLTVLSDDRDDNSTTDEFMAGLTDQKVETVVKTRLLMESEVGGTDIEVDVANGIVTLNGDVKSDAESDLATTIAKNTNDVKEVVNNLKVIKPNMER